MTAWRDSIPDPDDDRWSDEHRPEPLESGALETPRRKPPTAVGTVPPPREPRPPYRRGRYRGLTHFERITRTGLGALLASSGAALAVMGPLGVATVAGVGVLGAGVVAAYRALIAPPLRALPDEDPAPARESRHGERGRRRRKRS